jgi:hypothetical protein
MVSWNIEVRREGLKVPKNSLFTEKKNRYKYIISIYANLVAEKWKSVWTIPENPQEQKYIFASHWWNGGSLSMRVMELR